MKAKQKNSWMMIPTRRRELLRKYEGAIFFSKDTPRRDRLYSFYLLLRPFLGWLRNRLVLMGLEKDEAESEIFLLTNTLFSNFDTTKSSIIPYLEKQLPWYIGRTLKSIQNRYSDLDEHPVFDPNMTYLQDEEFYWRVPGILFEEQYVGKFFTRAEKYLIYMILTADDKELSDAGLARRCGVERKRMKSMLSDLRALINWRESHE